MSHTEIVETRGDFRAVIVADDFPTAPDYDGQGYVFALGRHLWRGATVQELHRDSGDTDELGGPLEESLDRWGQDWERTERYLRAFFDVVGFAVAQTRDGSEFVCLVTRDQAEAWGVEAGDETEVARGVLEAWEAYAEGDCWGWRIETRVTVETTLKSVGGEILSETTEETWHELESCWGYYGSREARDVAHDVLESYAGGEV